MWISGFTIRRTDGVEIAKMWIQLGRNVATMQLTLGLYSAIAVFPVVPKSTSDLSETQTSENRYGSVWGFLAQMETFWEREMQLWFRGSTSTPHH